MRQSCTQLKLVVNTFSLSSGTLPNELKIIPDEIFSNIFRMLDMDSMGAVIITCWKFKLLYESDKTSLMDITCTALDNEALNKRRVGNLKYPLKLICLDLKLLLRPKFNLAIQRGEIKSSPGCHKKALLWIYKSKVTYEALRVFHESVSECPDVPILLFKGDPVFLLYKLPSAKQPGRVVSWKYLCISGGDLSTTWPGLINEIEGLQWVYFKPGESYSDEVTWTITTRKTVFIMESVSIKSLSGNIK
jgi:hypothetical protein